MCELISHTQLKNRNVWSVLGHPAALTSRLINSYFNFYSCQKSLQLSVSAPGVIICFSCCRGRRRSVASHRAVRPAKRTALTKLTIDEENIPSPSSPQPALQSKTKRSVSKHAAAHFKWCFYCFFFIIINMNWTISLLLERRGLVVPVVEQAALLSEKLRYIW